MSFFLADLGVKHQGLFKRVLFHHLIRFIRSYTWCSESGRGIPDIAAQANGFPIFFKGVEDVVGGTSGSTPVCVSFLPPI